MSSPIPAPEELLEAPETEQDAPMQVSGGEEEEGEGDAVMAGISDDSSEEEEEDEAEAAAIRDGFIVDEEDDEDPEEEDEERRKRRKRRKKHHRKQEEETLEDDDLELLEENTGASFKSRGRLTRLRRGRDSESPPAASSSKRRAVVESSDDDLDADEALPIQDLHNIWDDDRGGRDDDDDDDLGDMADFIESDEENEDGVTMDEQTREERRKEKRKQDQERRKKTRGAHSELAGIDANAWDEIYDVFGHGHDYDWALAADDELDYDEGELKPEMRYQDVFEPSEIRARMLTEDDDIIRAQDIPERMQLATSSMSSNASISLHSPLRQDDINGAAMWITQRISPRKTREFFSPQGAHQQLKAALVMAVTFVVTHIFIEEYEVPFLWTHRRDNLSYFDPNDGRNRFELLSQAELWRVYSLGKRYRSLVERRRSLETAYDRLQVEDKYYEEEIQSQIDSVEMIADVSEWLSMKYKDKKNEDNTFHFHDDEEVEATKKRKMPSRVSAYEMTKKSIVSRLAQGFGIQPHEVVLNYLAGSHIHDIDDQELNPTAFAEQFADPDPAKALPAEELLRRARMILAVELGKDPLLRAQIRNVFKENALITVVPTEKGIAKINERHPFFNFKYLYKKPIGEMLDSSQFLQILKAESELLVTVHIHLDVQTKADFERRLNDAFASDSFSETVKVWNEERARVVQDVLDQHLIPAGVKWTREYVREEVEDFLAARCGGQLRKRIDVAPYRAPDMAIGDVASVVAMSWGKGDPQRDAISIVFIDEAGRMREHTKIDNLVDTEMRDEFIDLLKRRKPNVIVIGGFSMATNKLTQRVKQLVNGGPSAEHGWSDLPNDRPFNIPVVYVPDDVARIYQHSTRAAEEFTALSSNAKYCVGLARFIQSPLNEYAALGSDITAVSLEREYQQLIPDEKLLSAFERAIVDVTAKVGVDINRAVADSYYQRILSFVPGLGPRKAQALIKKITSIGGNLVNRNQFVEAGLLTTQVYLNAAGFLRIPQDPDARGHKHYAADDSLAPDPLDDTRIHPEDYELARKMATDALELDEEDIHDDHPSQVVSTIMADHDIERKLSELNLDDFASSLFESQGKEKRYTLQVIMDELVRPFGEKREPFEVSKAWDVLTMISGEDETTLRGGYVVTCQVTRVQKSSIAVRLDSGLEGVIQASFLADIQPLDIIKAVPKGKTMPGVILNVIADLEQDSFVVELSTRASDVDQGDDHLRRIRPDDAWDHQRYEKDRELLQRKKRAEVDKARRVIKHPNFHNFNTAQAETYLDKQQRGDVIIRPSSKGFDHLAVTWKVDDKLYQHIDVTELNADPTGQSVGGQLIVDSTHTYADLDELIVNHVQAMARRVEELMAHERFKHGSEDELHMFLKNHLAANPGKSMYGFTLNRKRPGHFNLCFLASKNSAVQSWPVRVAPEAYYLFEAAAVGVPELCDAFKVRHLHESQIASAAGGKTPYGAGTRTPARPGNATPGRASVRQIGQIGRTPNPYGGATPRPATNYSAPPSNYMLPPQTPYGGGYQTPSHQGSGIPPPAPAPPSGMNPQRAAAMMQSGSATGWAKTWS